MIINTTINGTKYQINVEPHKRLIDMLREDLKLTGTKEGCGEGECGACTVLMDGKAVNSCLVYAIQTNDKEILTIEGIENDPNLNKIQNAFIEKGASQCGFCSPGMIMSISGLLLNNPHPTEDEIKTAIAGNLCRCTGYIKIIEAVKSIV